MSQEKSNEKMGRNPFQKPAKRTKTAKPSDTAQATQAESAAAPHPREEHDSPGAQATQSPGAEQASGAASAEKASPKKRPLKDAILESARLWKLQQLSLIRYDREKDAGRISLLTVRLENPKWPFSGRYELNVIRSKRLVLNMVSVQVQVA